MSTLAQFIAELDELITEREALLEFCELALERIAELEGDTVQADKGPDRPNRQKLTEREVKDIRAAYRGGMKQRDLAENYGVNPATISRTVRGLYH